jgi:hypothetical protein
MMIMPLYHVRHFKGPDVHTIAKFTSKQSALELAESFIKRLQSKLQQQGTQSIITYTYLTEETRDQDITLLTLTDTHHNPIHNLNTQTEGVSISLLTPTPTPENNYSPQSAK